MTVSIVLSTPGDGDEYIVDANGSADGVEVYLPARILPTGRILTLTEASARTWARQLTLAADEAADAAHWTPDEEQIEAYQKASVNSLGGVLNVSREYAIQRLQELHEAGLKL